MEDEGSPLYVVNKSNFPNPVYSHTYYPKICTNGADVFASIKGINVILGNLDFIANLCVKIQSPPARKSLAHKPVDERYLGMRLCLF
jgi:hypothetical protein